MVKILSWDVGIINLAYCLIDKKNDNEFDILKWGVINLIENQQTCDYQLRTGTKCSCIAKHCIYHKDKIKINNKNDRNNFFGCDKHKEKLIPRIIELENKNVKSKSKSKSKVCECDNNKKNIKCINCDNNAIYELDGTEYCWCEEHYKKKGIPFVKKINSKKISVNNCNKQQIQELSEILYLKLDNNKDFLNTEQVLIENQPTLKNPKMKTIATLLYSYFIIRGITDKEQTNSEIKEVRFVSPSNKLKINKNSNIILNKEKKKKSNNEKSDVYGLTKNLGKKYCKALINKEQEKFFENIKKHDDMCDAFLQGFQYLFNPVPIIFIEKLQKVDLEEINNPKKIKAKAIKKNDLPSK